MTHYTATAFVDQLKTFQSEEELEKIQRYFKTGKGDYSEHDQFMGVRMGQVFELAKAFEPMEPEEIERLLESPIHEVRAGGVSIMDYQARNRKTPESRKKELFDLYLRRHDRINNWDLVDRAAPHVVGGYLWDKPRGILYQLARSENLWERRTAIVCTWFFIRKGDVADTFAVGEILIDDPNEIIQKAVGSWLRTAGDKDSRRLLEFLDQHAAGMPRTALRYAVEHLEDAQRKYYLGLKNSGD